MFKSDRRVTSFVAADFLVFSWLLTIPRTSLNFRLMHFSIHDHNHQNNFYNRYISHWIMVVISCQCIIRILISSFFQPVLNLSPNQMFLASNLQNKLLNCDIHNINLLGYLTSSKLKVSVSLKYPWSRLVSN